MKKYLKYLLIILVFSFFQSCGKHTNQNDLEKMNLKGDVVLVVEEYQKGDKIKNRIISYNEQGYIETIFDETIFESMFPLLKTFYYKNNKIQSSNERGLEKSKYYVETKFIYDKNGILKSSIEKSYTGLKGTTIHEFVLDVNNNIIEEKYDAGGEILCEIHNFYNDNKKDSVVRKYTGGWNKIYTSYFVNGNVDKEIGLDLDSKKETIITYKYEYDAIGNWIQKKSFIDGKEDKEERKIYYKGDNISEAIKPIEDFKSKISSSNNNESSSNNSSGSSTNESSNNSSSNTYQQKNSQTEKRKCYECNGTGQCPKCSKPQSVRYKQGESPNDHNEIRLGMIVCTQCGGNLMNWGSDKNKSCYLCKASGWLYCPECNSSGNGSYIGKCKRCKGSGFDR